MTRLAFSRALAAAFLGMAITAGAAHGLSGPSSSNTAAKVDPSRSETSKAPKCTSRRSTKICTFGCVAYRELKRAIKADKKNLAS